MQETAANLDQSDAARHRLPVNEDAWRGSPQLGTSYDTYYRSPKSERAAQLVKALGWFSVGLGLAQLLAPRQVSRAIGMTERPDMMRVFGMRELASGIGILSQRRPTGWLWSRVAGDAMDLAVLGLAARSQQGGRRRIALTTAAVAGVAALDLLSSVDSTERRLYGEGAVESGELHVEKSLVINRSPQECYRFWHDFERFPTFMKHVQSVRLVDDNRMHWRAKGPAGTLIEWDAELTADEPDSYLAWRSLEGADVDNAGAVHFERAPGGRGTIVRVSLNYRPPGGASGALAAKMFGEEPAQQIDEDLRRFKWLIETGEIPTTVGQPAGPRGMVNRLLFRKGEAG